jgi:ATP-binding cassette, subfamily B, multidrug efflux pump
VLSNFKTLKYFFIEHKWAYLLGVVWLIFVDILQLILPEILRSFTDELQANQIGTEEIFRYGVYLLIIGFLLAFFRFLWRIFIIGTSKKLEFELRNKLFSHLLKLSTNYFNKSKTGDLMAHATNDINAVRMALGPGIVMVVDAVFITVIATFMMFLTTDVRLTILALFPLPFLAFASGRFGKTINQRFRKVQESFSSLTETVQENLSGIRVVKTFVQEEKEVEKFAAKNQNVFDKQMHLVKIFGVFQPLIMAISSLSYLIVIVYGGTLVINRTISLGDFIAFNSYLALLIWPMMAAGWVVNILQRGSASMARINNILNVEPEIVDRKDAVDLKNPRGHIEFRNTSFKFPDTEEYALKNFDLDIPAGSTVGVIGRTGSGKSTVASLLLHLFEAQQGEIRIDGLPIEKIKIESLRKHIGYVDQDSFLFSTTIADNIAFGVNEASIEEVQRVAKIAQVHENILDFPKGYETFVGERGVTLSGGQKQRISIARALIKDPQILILDDSLSAVDTDTEEKILGHLKQEMETKTSILIAHRISTIKDCDKIIVLDEGSILEEGTHEELLRNKSLYFELYEKQLLEEEITKED